MSSSEDNTLLNLLYLDVSRDFADVLFHLFLDQTKTTYYHWYCCGIHAPHSLNFTF